MVFMKAILALAVVVAALLTGFTIPVALVAHTSSGGVLVGARATCKPHGHRHHHRRCQRRSSPSPARRPLLRSSPTPTDTRAPTTPARRRSAPRPSPSPASSSSPPPPGREACVTRGPVRELRPLRLRRLMMNSNGFNTYVANNCCSDHELQANRHRPQSRRLVGHRHRARRKHRGAHVSQHFWELFNNWCGSGWGDIDRLHRHPHLQPVRPSPATYAQTMPHDSATIAQAAWISG